MNNIFTQLFAAQRILRSHPKGSLKRTATVESLQKTVPSPILAHFLRLVVNGGNGVAVVRGGSCSECHIRVPSCVIAALPTSNDVHVCEYCGCYLIPAADEIPTQRTQDLAGAHRRGKRNAEALVT